MLDIDMTPKQLYDFRVSRRLSQARLGEMLGYSVRAISYMESGDQPIRRATELACAAIENGITSYNDAPNPTD